VNVTLSAASRLEEDELGSSYCPLTSLQIFVELSSWFFEQTEVSGPEAEADASARSFILRIVRFWETIIGIDLDLS
jgi:hypothetical protein